jgi:nucleotide-binding universal stress UspA family protein
MPSFQHILIPFDGSEASQRAARIALEIAVALGSHTVFAYATTEFMREEDTKRLLGPALALAQKAGVKCETHVLNGYTQSIAQAIVSDAKSSASDLIVMGTHGREGVERLLLGSIAERVTRTAHNLVMLVRPIKGADRYAPQIKRILVAVDGSDPSNLALHTANDLAHALDASLEVVSVIPDVPISIGYGYGGGDYLPAIDYDRYASDLAANSQAVVSSALKALGEFALKPVQVNASSVPANGQRIAEAIVLSSENLHADLIVIGTHGRGGVEELLLGSVAQGVAHHAKIPVLLVRSSKHDKVRLS